MIKRLQESSKIQLKALLSRVDLRRHSPNHFIILSPPRVGSTLLHTYLNSHWNIHSYGEYLGKQRREGNTPDVKKFYGRMTGRLVTHTGCKIFYDYLQDPQLETVLAPLYSDAELYVIHLKRRDILATYISLIKARNSGAWSGEINHESVRIDISDLVEFLTNMEIQRAGALNKFSSKKIHEMYYEELTSNPQDELRKLQGFLGVKLRKLDSFLQKQGSHKSWKAQVKNYEEVRASLLDSSWSHLVS